ncbi:MAG: cation diffusion facilitator family transporter [Wenzhouxiangella sp.]
MSGSDKADAAKRAARRTSIAGALTNLTLTGVKGVGGWMSGSQALIADAIHSLADLLTDLIAFVAIRLGRAEADESHPYGHGKFETFGTLLLSGFLLATALGLGWNLLSDLLAGKTARNLGTVALIAAGLSVVLNEALFRYALSQGKKVDSRPIVANAWHHRADGLSSVAVLAGIVASLAGFVYGDQLAAAVVVVLLLRVTYRLGRDAFDELVEAAIDPQHRQAIAETIAQTEGVDDCRMLRARRLAGEIVLDVQVKVDALISVSEGHRIAELVEHRVLHEHADVTDVTVHIGPAGHAHDPAGAAEAPMRDELEKLVESRVAAICPGAEIADLVFHFVGSEIHAELVFAVFPDDDAGKRRLEQALTADDAPFAAVRLLQKL